MQDINSPNNKNKTHFSNLVLVLSQAPKLPHFSSYQDFASSPSNLGVSIRAGRARLGPNP